MPQHVTVVDYDPKWPSKYQRERDAISAVLDRNCLSLYHIGSTSVPGLPAKPIIDIMAVVKSLEEVDVLSGKFEELGYECLGEFGMAGRRYFRKGGDERTHQLHAFQVDDWPNIARHLAFRDYMRTHEEEQREYGSLKKSLAMAFPYDIKGYCEGKEAFFREREARALTLYDGSWDRLFLAARKVQGERRVSSFVEVGGVAAALLTSKGNIYVGVCIDTPCSLGMCAERNAIANMLTNGESQIRKLVAIMPNGNPGMPCGACREAMMQLSPTAGDIEILSSYEPRKTVRLKTLIPEWWGASRDGTAD